MSPSLLQRLDRCLYLHISDHAISMHQMFAVHQAEETRHMQAVQQPSNDLSNFVGFAVSSRDQAATAWQLG